MPARPSARFAARGIAAATSARSRPAPASASTAAASCETIWDFAKAPLIGAGRRAIDIAEAVRMNASDRPLRIAMLTHSTNPRGGVVHALELADA